MELVLEIFVCASDEAGAIRYTHFQFDITNKRCDPDQLLHEELSDIGVCLENECSIVHSTSWRYEEGKTVLTYLVWSPLEQMESLTTNVFAASDYGLAVAQSRRKPRPLDIRQTSVLSHGLRHFRFLAEQQELPTDDPVLCESITKAIQQCIPEVAGKIN